MEKDEWLTCDHIANKKIVATWLPVPRAFDFRKSSGLPTGPSYFTYLEVFHFMQCC